MSILIPSDKGFECLDCDFVTEDIFIFLDHCDISFTWGMRLSNRYTLDLYSILNELNNRLQKGETEPAIDLIQSVTLALTNASEGERNFHRFIHEAITSELATDMVRSIEEMLKNNEKPNKTE